MGLKFLSTTAAKRVTIHGIDLKKIPFNTDTCIVLFFFGFSLCHGPAAQSGSEDGLIETGTSTTAHDTAGPLYICRWIDYYHVLKLLLINKQALTAWRSRSCFRIMLSSFRSGTALFCCGISHVYFRCSLLLSGNQMIIMLSLIDCLAFSFLWGVTAVQKNMKPSTQKKLD